MQSFSLSDSASDGATRLRTTSRSVVDPETAAEFMEAIQVLQRGVVDVFCFCNELHIVNAWHFVLAEHSFTCLIISTIDHQEFVLIHLNFERFPRIQYRDAEATVIKEQILKIQQNALKHTEVNTFTTEIEMLTFRLFMTGFNNYIDCVTQPVEQRQKRVHQDFAGYRRHNDRDFRIRLVINVSVVTIAGLRNDNRIESGTHCISQHEIVVLRDAHVFFQLLFGQIAKAADVSRWSAVAIARRQKIAEGTHVQTGPFQSVMTSMFWQLSSQERPRSLVLEKTMFPAAVLHPKLSGGVFQIRVLTVSG